MSKFQYDYEGWASKNDLKCSDGRTIRAGAFKDCDGKIVPIAWQHQHDDPKNILGHALLMNKDEGVYTYLNFNDTPNGQLAKQLIAHKDITGLSIYANQLQQSGKGDVYHGDIKEVSLVLATANPGAKIEFSTLSHSGDIVDDEATLWTGENLVLQHGEIDYGTPAASAAVSFSQKPDLMSLQANLAAGQAPAQAMAGAQNDLALAHSDNELEAAINSMNDVQKNALYTLVGAAMAGSEESLEHSGLQNGGDSNMRNAFQQNTGVMVGMQDDEISLSHAQQLDIITEAKESSASLKKTFLAHADDYGIKDIEWLFPEARNVNTPPDWIKRPDDWVSNVMGAVHHVPFSRIKTMQADITADEARAKGYIKGHMKKEEVFTLLKRSTTPTTVYKKQKLDRDDVIDITDFDVVAWIKAEMRMMLNEELARAFLVGDGRLSDDEDKIREDCIRPVWKDTENDLYAIRKVVTIPADAKEDDIGRAFIRAAIRARKDYRGSGRPTLYTTEDMLTTMLLMEDGIGHLLYESEAKLATVLRVKEIVTVPVMEGLQRSVDGVSYDLMGIIVNLSDYYVGADKGGAISMFEDFDIDYNQQKYLIETRCSGALAKVKSALVFECQSSAATSAAINGESNS